MSYIKHNWSNGETITASWLNNIEEGVESISPDADVLLVSTSGNFNDGCVTSDTLGSIREALIDNKLVFILFNKDPYYGSSDTGAFILRVKTLSFDSSSQEYYVWCDGDPDACRGILGNCTSVNDYVVFHWTEQ